MSETPEQYMQALVELVQEGSVGVAEATRMFQSEFCWSLGSMNQAGYVTRLMNAERRRREK